MVIFCLLNNILYYLDYDEEGNYKYSSNENLKKEKEELEQELKKYNVNESSDVTMHISLKTKIEIIELKEKFKTTSWQYRKINDYLYDTIFQKNTYLYKEEDIALSEEITNQYYLKLKKLNQGDWKYFLNLEKIKQQEEQESLKMQLEEAEDNAVKIELEEKLEETEFQLKIIEYREKENIKEDSSYLNIALENYQENIKKVKYYENRTRTREEEIEYQKALSESQTEQYIIKHKQNINKQNNLAYQLRTILEDYEIFMVILVLIVAATIICEEFQTGTIKLLLIKPFSRCKILLSKYLTSILVMIISIAFLILIQLVIGGLFFGLDSLSLPVIVYNHKIASLESYSILRYMGIRILSKIPFFLMLLTITFGIGIFLTNTAITIMIPLTLYLFSFTLNQLAIQYHLKFMRFLINMNWNFQDYLFGKISEYPYIDLKFSSLIWMIYFIGIGVFAFIGFQKKDIKNI